MTGCIALCGGNIVRIVRLAAYPVHSYEFSVAGAAIDGLRRALAEVAVRCEVDVAVQAAGLHRRAKHLIVLDADSTLLQGEMIDLLAERCRMRQRGGRVGVRPPWRARSTSPRRLRQRVRLLAGLPASELEARA